MVIIYIESLIKKNKFLVGFLAVILLLPTTFLSKIFFIWAIINFVYYFRKYNCIFNPLSVFMTMFLLMIGFSQMKLTPIEQDDFTLNTWIALYSVIFGFYFSSFIASRKFKINMNSKLLILDINSNKLSFANYILIAIELVVYGYIYIKVGGIPLQSDYLRANVMPKVISGYVMTIAIFPGFFIIINSLYYSFYKEVKYLLFNVLYLGLIASLGGRINLLLPLGTTVISIYLAKSRTTNFKFINNKKLIIAGGLIVVLLAAIPMLRTKEYSNNYYKHIYEYREDQYAPEIILPVWINLSTNLHAFDKLVTYVDENNDYQYGRMGLLSPIHFITKHFIPDKVVNFDEIWKGWLNSPTFLFYPYYDFGVFGVLVFTLLIGFIGTRLYINAVSKNSILGYIVYSYFCTSLILLIFVNHFLRSAFYIDIVVLTLIYLFVSDKILPLHKLKNFKFI